MALINITVNSNVKNLTSGNVPTTTDLKVGEMGFGLITADSEYHLFVNSKGTIVDLFQTKLGNIVSTITSPTQPTGQKTGDYWNKVLN